MPEKVVSARGRPRTAPAAAPSKTSVRSYLLEPKYITELVVKGRGSPRARYTRTEAKDLHKSARVHYFSTQPANKFVDMKLDVRQRVAHAERVLNAQKKIDNRAPRLLPQLPRTERAAFRLDDLMLENKQLLERICTIWRTKGRVDTSAPNVERKSNFRERMWNMVRAEADNVAQLYFIQQATPLVPTRDECARDFGKAVQKMRFTSKFPLTFLKDTSVDLPLPMPNPPAVDPEAPPRRRVFMDFITSQERFLGRIELELFEEQAPRTAANFLAHIRGEAPCPPEGEGQDGEGGGRTYTYRDTPLHRILPGYYCLGGDVVSKNGSAGSSIHGGVPFADEKNELTHCEPGLLCTIGSKADANDSKFMLTMKPLTTLDASSTVFGRVVRGFEVLWAINTLGAKASGKPVVQVYCCNCGELGRARTQRRRRLPKRRRADGDGDGGGAEATGGGAGGGAGPQAAQRHAASWRQQGRSYSSARMSVSSGGEAVYNRSPYASARNLRP